MPPLWILLIALNLFAFLLFGFDKARARKRKRRVPEQTLWIATLPFASLGALLGMWVFQHKTRKWLFSLGLPLLFAIHVAFAYRWPH